MPVVKAKQPDPFSSGWLPRNNVQLVKGGSAYFSLLLRLIGQAKESIHLQTYIFDHDETGILVAGALMEAAKRKVEVHLMADGYASRALPGHFTDELKAAGIHFRFFEPVFRSRYFYFGRRLHHKLFVADTRYALVGGINISNKYNDLPGKPAWLDFTLFIEGELSRELCILCWKTWNGFPANMGLTPCEKNYSSFDHGEPEYSLVRMRRNDWVRRKNQISRTYLKMLLNAQRSVTFLCSYFLPGNVIRRNIARARKRGVKIKVIMAGLSDVPMAKNAERFMYDWMLRNGVEVYEYRKNILHGKLAVCDNEWMTIGSYNVNNISAYASIELNVDVKGPVIVHAVEEMLEGITANDCTLITTEHLVHTRNIFRQFIRWSSYRIFSLILYLFTFYFKQRKYF